jgi:hypothetical protein
MPINMEEVPEDATGAADARAAPRFMVVFAIS